MATGSGTTRLEANQKIRNDHELFLEAYERPTQIYRFLKARHSLEPLFLQRNLSYMKKCRMKRGKISLSKLIQASQQVQVDLSQGIKSDNHLNLSFKSISRGIDFSKPEKGRDGDDELFRKGCPMEIEVVLYQFKHPTAEALVTSAQHSLSCVCTSLGKCIIPYSNSGDTEQSADGHMTISIPESVLSWKGTNGIFGTHMLAFRVTPLNRNSNGTSGHTRTRKRNTTAKNNATTMAGTNELVVATEKHNGIGAPEICRTDQSLPNGVIGKKRNYSRTIDPLMEREVNGQFESDYNKEMMKRLQRKVPGGKTLPLISGGADKLVVSVSRSVLQETVESCDVVQGSRKRKALLKQRTKQTSGKNSSLSSLNKCHEDSTVTPDVKYKHSTTNTRKRNGSTLAHHEDLDTFEQPPSIKKTCLTNDRCYNNIPSSIANSPSVNDKDCYLNEMYFAELVAFDSRQECLLVNGEYELLLQRSVHEDKKKKIDEEMGDCQGLPSLDKDSLFNVDVVSDQDSSIEVYNLNNLTLKFSAKWVPHPPKPRATEMAETAYDLLKLRKSFDGIDNINTPNPDQHNRHNSREPRCSTPCPSKPTIFNFLYKNDTLQQTELKDNYTCPWCSLDCRQLYCLLKHMSLCHPRFKFSYNSNEKGLPCVNVRINRHYDTIRLSDDPVDVVRRDAVSIRRKPTKLKSTTLVLVDRCEECDYDLSEFTTKRQLSSPELFRTFYHSQTCLPMLPHETDRGDEESSSEWLKIASMKMVDEFIDVNFGEKQFMKVWNSFMMDNRVLADKHIPRTCIKFAREKLKELQEKKIIYNLMSHMMYMCDIGLVPSSTILDVFKIITQAS